MAKEKINVVRIDTDPAKKSLKDLRKELMEIRNEMVNLEEGSDAFLEMAKKGGELQHQISEISESIRGASSDFGDMVGNVTNVMAGITGAFQAVAGGLQAMGMESEALDKTIAKMQGLMAVTQGLSAIDDGIKSFGKLTKAIQGSATAMKLFKAISNPVALAAVAAVIVTIGAAWNKWGDSLRKSLPWLDEFIKKWDGTAAEEAERIAEAQRKFNEELAVSNAEVAEILQNRKWNAITKEAQDRIKFLEDEIKIYENKVKNIVKQQEGATEAEWNRLNQIGLEYLEQIRLWKAEIDDLYNNPKYQLSNQPKPTKTTSTSKTPAVKKTKEEILAEMGLVEFTDQDLAEGLERVKKYWEGVYDIQLEQNKRSEKTDAEKLAKEIEIEEQRLTLYKEGTLEFEKQQTKIWELKNGLSENGVIELALENDRLKEMAKGWLYNEETAFETFDRISSELKIALDRDLITQEQYDKAVKNLAKERSRYIVEQSSKAFTATATLATTILDGLADSQDKNNKEGFEKSKKLQIASATINMLSGITAAIAGLFTTKSGPWDIALAAIQAATIAASGAIQINKIKKTTFEGASGAAANISSSAANTMIVPPVQYSNAVTGASIDGNIKDSRVYVTETDIKNTMNKVSVQENENIY
jgi:hypothetical protein